MPHLPSKNSRIFSPVILFHDNHSSDHQLIQKKPQENVMLEPNSLPAFSDQECSKEQTKKRRGNLPKDMTAVLKEWLKEHSEHPYPTEEEKKCLVEKTTLSLNQISNWFINARRRLLPVLLSNPPLKMKRKTNQKKRSKT